jgi:hypothetical protein
MAACCIYDQAAVTLLGFESAYVGNGGRIEFLSSTKYVNQFEHKLL